MKACFNRYNIIFGLLLVALIMVAEVAIYYLRLPGWPMFAALVFFFLGHLDTKTIPAIFVGSVIGIICTVLMVHFTILLMPALGDFIPKLIFIGLFVFLIVLFKDVVPLVFNSYAFMVFLMVGMVYGTTAPLVLAAIALLGGGFLIGGTIIISKWVAPLKESENNKEEVIHK